MKTIAALFVETRGIYYYLAGVDPWDKQRDATKYDGMSPVVAHPPCERWCGLARCNQSRYGLMVGDDGGTFRSALNSVRIYYGVLEHPAYSLAWEAHFLPRPSRGKWTYHEHDNSWVCEVSQSAYGHAARKRTWLYYKGDIPPFEMKWNEPKATARISKGPGSDMSLPQLPSNASNHSPVAFALELCELARNSRK